MVRRNIVWTKTADVQLSGILEYWVHRNKSNSYSRKLVQLVSERTEQIAKSPLIYKSTGYDNYRIASIGNFSIIYKITDSEIIITSFWDNRQDPNKLLKILEGE